jgi:hypothetical protein
MIITSKLLLNTFSELKCLVAIYSICDKEENIDVLFPLELISLSLSGTMR